MRRLLPMTATATLLGAVIGATAALRWINLTAAAGGPETAWSTALRDLGFPITLALGVLGALVLRIAVGLWFTLLSARTSLLLSGVIALAAYLLSTAFFGILSTADQRYPAWGALGLIALCLVAVASGKRRLALALLLTSVAGLDVAGSLRLVAGDDLAVASLTYAPLAPAHHYVGVALSLCLLGAMCGLTRSWLTGAGAPRAVAAGVATGAVLAICVCCSQTTIYLAAMGSGQDPGSVFRVSVITWSSLATAIALALLGFSGYRRFGLLRLAPVVVLAAIGEYAFIASYGASEFHSLSRRGPDSTYAYIHFLSDGTWQRTLDERGSAAQTENARRFVLAYCYSAYRPAAMLAEAEGEFELWNFAEASRILQRVETGYPVLDGYGSVLLALSDLAGGKGSTILRPAAEGSRFATWRATQGAQMAAGAAEKLGQPVRARGLHSAYIDYLLSRPGASWTSHALAFSKARLDFLTAGTTRPTKRATVRLRVSTDAGPVSGARVALVQPHRDAALPSDSSRFVGAWTMPAWNGVWGVADRDGVVTIRDVPWGDYEVVLGLDFRTAPRRHVVKEGVSKVTVRAAHVEIAPIRLAPSVNQVRPLPGAAVGREPTLSWDPYPGARSYALSLVALGGRQRGATCWARSRITSTRAAIDAAHFLNGHPGLVKGIAYMWIVYAYDANGSLLSSSEHYFDLNERVFVVN